MTRKLKGECQVGGGIFCSLTKYEAGDEGTRPGRGQRADEWVSASNAPALRKRTLGGLPREVLVEPGRRGRHLCQLGKFKGAGGREATVKFVRWSYQHISHTGSTASRTRFPVRQTLVQRCPCVRWPLPAFGQRATARTLETSLRLPKFFGAVAPPIDQTRETAAAYPCHRRLPTSISKECHCHGEPSVTREKHPPCPLSSRVA